MRATTLEDYQQRLGRVVAHIEADVSAILAVEGLARIASFSPFHFNRVFRGMIGETVKAYVKRLRLERAAFALNDTDRTRCTPPTSSWSAAGFRGRVTSQRMPVAWSST